MFWILYAFLWLLMWLPLPLLYPLSDFCALLMYHVIRYRRKLVHKNLCNSFPDKTPKEIHRMEWKVYRNFVDVMIESMYSIHMSKSEIKKRLTYSGKEVLDEALAKKQACFIMTAHYGNYEWLTGAKLSFEKDYNYFTIYRALSNKHFDKIMMDVRQRRHNINIEMHDLMRQLEKNHQAGVTGFYGMIADQKPSRKNPSRWHWTTFLGQDTPFLTGTEYLAKKYDYAVIYARMSKLGRGRYHCHLEMLCDEPTLTAPGEITEKYARLLEQDLMAAPEAWLWTHNRWKYRKDL